MPKNIFGNMKQDKPQAQPMSDEDLMNLLDSGDETPQAPPYPGFKLTEGAPASATQPPMSQPRPYVGDPTMSPERQQLTEALTKANSGPVYNPPLLNSLLKGDAADPQDFRTMSLGELRDFKKSNKLPTAEGKAVGDFLSLPLDVTQLEPHRPMGQMAVNFVNDALAPLPFGPDYSGPLSNAQNPKGIAGVGAEAKAPAPQDPSTVKVPPQDQSEENRVIQQGTEQDHARLATNAADEMLRQRNIKSVQDADAELRRQFNKEYDDAAAPIKQALEQVSRAHEVSPLDYLSVALMVIGGMNPMAASEMITHRGEKAADRRSLEQRLFSVMAEKRGATRQMENQARQMQFQREGQKQHADLMRELGGAKEAEKGKAEDYRYAKDLLANSRAQVDSMERDLSVNDSLKKDPDFAKRYKKAKEDLQKYEAQFQGTKQKPTGMADPRVDRLLNGNLYGVGGSNA